MNSGSTKGAIIFATGMEEKTISRHFSPQESGTLLEYVLDSVWTVADELFVVFRNEPKLTMIEAISPFGVKVLTVPKNQNPIQTISDAFKSSKSEQSLLVTERVPLLKPNVALALFESARNNDAAIPRWTDGRIEPLLAVYRKNALTRLVSTRKQHPGTNLLKEFETLTEQLFDVKFLSVEKDLTELDPELDSLFQVKDEKSLIGARERASVKSKRGQLKKVAK